MSGRSGNEPHRVREGAERDVQPDPLLVLTASLCPISVSRLALAADRSLSLTRTRFTMSAYFGSRYSGSTSVPPNVSAASMSA